MARPARVVRGRRRDPDRKARFLSDDELLELDRSWRQGWAQEFPAEEYPGLVEARRRIREKFLRAGKLI